MERHGVAAHHLLAYMLVGYDRRETWERVLYRFRRMTERGIRPFPMISRKQIIDALHRRQNAKLC